MTSKDLPRAPSSLSTASRRIWRAIQSEYLIDDAPGLEILKVSLEALDRVQAARQEIDKTGMTVRDKFGQLKPHPLLSTERDSRAAFLSGLKQLQLESEPGKAKAPGRPTDWELNKKTGKV